MNRPHQHAKFFLGVDPAPSESQRSDDGAVAVGVAYPRYDVEPEGGLPENEADWFFDLVYGRVFTAKEKLSARQWSGIVHWLHQAFGFEKILMDAGSGGGGIYVKRELMADEQVIEGVKTKVVPIADQVDGWQHVVRANFILHMFKRGDPGVDRVWPDPANAGKSLAGDELLKDALYSSVKETVDRVGIGLPPDVDEVLARKREVSLVPAGTLAAESHPDAWLLRQPEAWVWALKVLQAFRAQLTNILVATVEDKDGHLRQVYTKRGARVFTSTGKDDVALGGMYAYGAFRIWLMSEDFQGGRSDENAAAFCGASVQ